MYRGVCKVCVCVCMCRVCVFYVLSNKIARFVIAIKFPSSPLKLNDGCAWDQLWNF